MKSRSLPPVVGYQGGKRRLLVRLRPYFNPSIMTNYVEPFTGMGASYLDLRVRGYCGPAILADSNAQVANFWRIVHDYRGPDLIEAAKILGETPATAERFYEMVEESVEDEIELVARFLWLTNFAFGNVPKLYFDDHWSRQGGTKLTSSEKWGKTFPWGDCIKRLSIIVDALHGLPCVVYDDAASAVQVASSDACIYADPPYVGHRGYKAAQEIDYVDLLSNSDANLIVLSESPAVAERLREWIREDGSVVARTSGGKGATGSRSEVLYIRLSPRLRIPPDWLCGES